MQLCVAMWQADLNSNDTTTEASGLWLYQWAQLKQQDRGEVSMPVCR